MFTFIAGIVTGWALLVAGLYAAVLWHDWRERRDNMAQDAMPWWDRETSG